ncbi:enoyl-CoA hydratase [Alkalibaculum sp. M08DMB]|uniref:short-chain-enoyl-CoA hydratase n=1 Tax=Alkalibaculum sporogenes TaxID=2655001 RepID=A0A6A7KB24_9FIRM|nr:enoyl-CoA hydratase [Alkalibaculum sporogenes]MPW26545.1 enoyl-CoA hydratase [Alkalibaculum sporogenes]
MKYESISLTKKEGVAIIKLNNPKTMNALEDKLAAELTHATTNVANDPEIGAVILTGAEKAFCAGGDLKKLSQGFTTVEGYDYMKGFHSWVIDFMGMPKPTIAAVNGYAVGAGFCIALLCDIVIASENAKFGQAFVNVGLIPDLAGLYTLPRIVGLQKAKELVFTGRNIDAQEASELGIVNQIVEHNLLDEETFKFAKKMADGPRVALRMAKSVMNASINMTLEQLLEIESQAQAQCFQTEDHRNAVKAFFNKEKPNFIGK